MAKQGNLDKQGESKKLQENDIWSVDENALEVQTTSAPKKSRARIGGALATLERFLTKRNFGLIAFVYVATLLACGAVYSITGGPAVLAAGTSGNTGRDGVKLHTILWAVAITLTFVFIVLLIIYLAKKRKASKA